MTTKNALFIASLLFLGVSSCKKDKDETPAPAPEAPATSNYCPLTIGSYWIYDRFNLDTNGVETYVSTDSCYISHDTVIGGNTYAVVHGGPISTFDYMRRDSSGYLVDQNGEVFFSSTNFTDTINTLTIPGYLVTYSKMQPAASITVPAGTYSAYECLSTTNITQPGYLWDTTRYTHHWYADNVGLVYDSFFFLSSPNYVIRKLVRYHIQ